tara:strand:+ start:3053 stop:3253 length:201 start_codon:yes stop_codon:yes gene_type:complete
MNSDDLMKINHQLGMQLQLLTKKLDIAIVGLEAIISNNSDTLKIAEKTIQEVENYNLPQGVPPKEE